MVAEKASIDESYLDLTAAARHRLATRGPPWAHGAEPVHIDQIRVGLQVRGSRARTTFVVYSQSNLCSRLCEDVMAQITMSSSVTVVASLQGPTIVPPLRSDPNAKATLLEGDGALDMASWLRRGEAEWSQAEQLLAHGAAIIAEKRAAVLAELSFTVSAGAPLPVPGTRGVIRDAALQRHCDLRTLRALVIRALTCLL